MTTETSTVLTQGTTEGQAVQATTTEDAFYGKPNPEPTATATATDEAQKPATEVKKDEPAPVTEFEIKLPENAVLEPELAKEFAKYAKEKGMTQEVAQEMFEKQNTLVSTYVQRQQETIQNEINQWAEQAKSDKEVGGERFNESVQLAKQVIDKFGTPELKTILERGMGNHPEAVRVFARIGKELFANDQMVLAKANTKVEKSVEELFYGSNK